MVELKVFDESGGFEPFQQEQFVQRVKNRSWLSLYEKKVQKAKLKQQQQKVKCWRR